LKNYSFQPKDANDRSGPVQARRIRHNKFGNSNCSQALKHLTRKPVGDFLFRPSRQENRLTLTWKIYDNCFVHVEVQEQERGPTDAMGRTLVMQGQVYQGLTDIQERFILPCNKLVREIIDSPKFMRNATSTEEVRARLELEKKDNASVIPYKFAILENYPQHVVLCYIPRANMVREFVKVKPNGYWFHQKAHTSVQALTAWFKQNFKDSEYRKYAKRAKSPRVLTQEELQQKRRAEEEQARPFEGGSEFRGGIDITPKRERFGASPRSSGGFDRPMGGGRGRGGGGNCYKCDQPGHLARECPSNDFDNAGRGRGRGRGIMKEERYGDEDGGEGYKRQKTEDAYKQEDSGGFAGGWGSGS